MHSELTRIRPKGISTPWLRMPIRLAMTAAAMLLFSSASAQTMFFDGFETRLAGTQEQLDVTLNNTALASAVIVTELDEQSISLPRGSQRTATANVTLPETRYSFVYLVDESEAIIGMWYGIPGADIAINARSTAVGLVVGLSFSWPRYAETMTDYLSLVESSTAFPALVDAVTTVMSSQTPAALIDDPNGDIYPLIADVLREIDGGTRVANDPRSGVRARDLPTVSGGGAFQLVISNPRFVPFGISAADIDTGDCLSRTGMSKAPFWANGRDWLKLWPGSTVETRYRLAPGHYLLCTVKHGSLVNPLIDDALDSISATEADYVSIAELLEALDLNSGDLEDRIKADAYIKGSIAYTVYITLNAIAMVPKVGDGISIAGTIGAELVNTDYTGIQWPVAGFTGLTLTGMSTLATKLADNASAGDSTVRKIARLVKGDPTKVKSIRISLRKMAKQLATIAVIPDVINLIGLYTDGLLEESVGCQIIDVASDGSVSVSAYAGEYSGLSCQAPIAPGDTFTDCAGCPPMVEIPAGTFVQGSPLIESGHQPDEYPQRIVNVSAFAMSQTEVTFDQWDACVADGGCSHSPDDSGWGRGDRPVINVSWEDAQEYVTWLSNRTGEDYRLPSESEWEYATRAGTTGRFNTGDCITTDQANFNGNLPPNGCPAGVHRQHTLPVASFAPNAFGLYDTHGNIFEWVQDCYNSTYTGAPIDGKAWMAGDCASAVIRGGSIFLHGNLARSAFRNPESRPNRSNIYGFRVARSASL